jgi:predicted  nucleic acid-binding Zn-ribbon protein
MTRICLKCAAVFQVGERQLQAEAAGSGIKKFCVKRCQQAWHYAERQKGLAALRQLRAEGRNI